MAATVLQIATAVALVGLLLMLWAGWMLARRWRTLTPRLRWLCIAAFATFEAAYWLNVYAWLIEPRMLMVRRVEIVSEEWRGAPITLAVLSDTHVPSPHMSVARMGGIVSRVNALRPDLVVLLGDYVGGHAAAAQRSPEEQNAVATGIATFAAFSAPLGAVAVIGNHDVWYDRAAITRALEEAGVAALWNRHVVISGRDGDLAVVGLADPVTASPSYEEAIDGAPEGADVIVLAHSPDAFPNVPSGPVLLLAGHTHCGQVSAPLLGRPLLPIVHKQYGCHRVDEAGRTVFVTGGIGTSMLPVRFLNPPEIVLIELRGPNAVESEDGLARG